MSGKNESSAADKKRNQLGPRTPRNKRKEQQITPGDSSQADDVNVDSQGEPRRDASEMFKDTNKRKLKESRPFNMRLDVGLYQDLRTAAFNQEVTMTEIVEGLIRNHLDESPKSDK